MNNKINKKNQNNDMEMDVPTQQPCHLSDTSLTTTPQHKKSWGTKKIS